MVEFVFVIRALGFRLGYIAVLLDGSKSYANRQGAANRCLRIQLVQLQQHSLKEEAQNIRIPDNNSLREQHPVAAYRFYSFEAKRGMANHSLKENIDNSHIAGPFTRTTHFPGTSDIQRQLAFSGVCSMLQ